MRATAPRVPRLRSLPSDRCNILTNQVLFCYDFVILVVSSRAVDSAVRETEALHPPSERGDEGQTLAALRFLAEASRVLSSSLDYETTLNNVAALAVPA